MNLFKKVLNIILDVLKSLKNAGLFKKGTGVDDLTPKKKYPPYK